MSDLVDNSNELLSVEGLSVEFATARGALAAVDDVSFSLKRGETLGIVGESGSGKSVSSLAIMGLLAENATVNASRLKLLGQDVLKMNARQRRKFGGQRISMIFQDPMNSLNPCFTVGFQLRESLQALGKKNRREIEALGVELLAKVGIPDPEKRWHSYPHELSGGMCQRVMIAMAIAGSPQLLIADEPTTALDVTIQAQILDLLRDLKEENEMAMILITHDIGVVAEQADRILVMYAGQVVEQGTVEQVIHSPMHPYTRGLLQSMPSFNDGKEFRSPLSALAGVVPDLVHRPSGCQLAERCPTRQDRCVQQMPPLIERQKRYAKCFYPLDGES